MEIDSVIQQMKEIAPKYKIDKLVLFGSRARGDHSIISDYDIAVFGKSLSALEKAKFWADVDEIETLKKIDLVFVDEGEADDLMESIKREGVTVYE